MKLPLSFDFTLEGFDNDNKERQIFGVISSVINYGSHFYISVETINNYSFVTGYYEKGLFIYFPSLNIAATLLPDLTEVYKNAETLLSKGLNIEESIITSHVLKILKKENVL